MTKTYPIGTQIRYLGNCDKCNGKTGKIVEVHEEHCYITLPQSTCSAFNAFSGKGKIISGWNDIEPLVIKGQQLLFSFYERDYV